MGVPTYTPGGIHTAGGTGEARTESMSTTETTPAPTPFYDAEAAADITRTVAGHTLTSWFAATVAARPDAVALREDDGTPDGRSWTWAQYSRDALRVAAALQELGIGRGDRVALMLRNRPEFHLSDMGALLVAATPFSIYNSSPPEQIQYLLAHSEAKVAIVEGPEFAARLAAVRDRLPDLEHVFVVGPAPADDPAMRPFAELLDAAPLDLQEACGRARPDDIATLVYTSGTTGPPKGAMTAHHRVCWMIECYRRALGVDLAGTRIVSYLPMAHVLERDVSHWLAVLVGAEVTTCPDPAQIGAYLRRVRPHFFAAVPRVWEKLGSAVKGMDRTPAAAQEFEDALARHDHEALAPVRELLGLDACEVAFSGGAPLPGDVLGLFVALGVPLGEGWGMTESTFVPTFDHRNPRPRAVGRILPGVELKIAPDGEVLARGPFVFRGYLKDEERTAEAIDADGWLHTGDVGTLDEDSYLRIVDRKKELIITAGGKNVAPSNLEAALKGHPLIGQACVVGDRRPYLTALLVLDGEVAPGWARAHGVAPVSTAELASDPRVRAALVAAVAAVNATVSRTEGIKRFAVLHEEWLPDSEELTPTMKLKRRGILARYAGTIDALYAGDPAVSVDVALQEI
jgi:long-chain acyl-CoA synthetase